MGKICAGSLLLECIPFPLSKPSTSFPKDYYFNIFSSSSGEFIIK